MTTELHIERFPVAEGSNDEFDALASGYVAEARAHPGCLWAELAHGHEEGTLVLSEWRTGPDLETFRASDVAAVFDDEAAVLLTGDPTRRRFSSAPSRELK